MSILQTAAFIEYLTVTLISMDDWNHFSENVRALLEGDCQLVKRTTSPGCIPS